MKMKERESEDEGRSERRGRRGIERERERDRRRQRQTGRGDRDRHNTCDLAKTKLEITCKALAGSTRKFAQLLDSSVRVQRRVERDHIKKPACELVITSGVRNDRLWRARTPSICE